MCLSNDRIGLPLQELTPEERACVTNVGEGWQGRVDESLGGSGHYPTPIPDVYLRVMRGATQVGSLRLVGGAVTLCMPQATCEVVGHGLDAIAAAENTLNHLGLETEPMA